MAVLPRLASGPGRHRTCMSPGKSRELCRVELRSRRCDRQESNLRRPAFQAGALPLELRSRAEDGRGWTRTSNFLLVRQALSAIELLALEDPGQGVEPRPPRSERGVLPVRRSRNVRLRPTPERELDAVARASRISANGARHPCRTSYFHATRLLFDPGSPTAGVHICGTMSSWRSFGARASRVS